MSKAIKSIVTRFRGYQLGTAGSSFSYFADDHFTLMEARATDLSKPQLRDELNACGKKTIDTLHITSWDQDHCSTVGLEWILQELAPSKIETPGYPPHTDSGKNCESMINEYRAKWAKLGVAITTLAIDPPYIQSLSPADPLCYKEILYHPRELFDKSNDNSTIKFFRSGCFNVLSLGDVEDVRIAALLKRCKTLCREVDVMILAHHGADNGFTTKNLLEKLSPKVAVCSSNYENKYDHPRQEIRDLLFEQEIKLCTTKTGDFIIESIGGHTMDYRVTNWIAGSSKVSSTKDFRSRKSKLLLSNADTIRNVLRPGFKGLRYR